MSKLARNVGWAMLTDHAQRKQKDFRLLDSITYGTLRDCIISTLIDRKTCHLYETLRERRSIITNLNIYITN